MRKIVTLLMSYQRKDGLIVIPGEKMVMYAHGFSTLYLSQVYGMTQDKRIKKVLHGAIELIMKSQSEMGGWDYEPYTKDDEGSVTIVQIQALRACKDAGLQLPYEVIQKVTSFGKEIMGNIIQRRWRF